MVANDVGTRLREVFSDVLGCDPASLCDESAPGSVEGWDSVNHMQLLLAVEDAFGLEFAAEEFASLMTFGALRVRVEGRGAR